MAYSYLLASLPVLTLERAPAIGEAAFRAGCASQLAAHDAAAVEDVFVSGGQESRHPFLEAWRERETRLRNAVARARAARLGQDPAPHLRPERGFDVSTLEAVAAAFKRATPAEREFDLDRFRWRVLDELAGPAGFTAGQVLAYALKLRLALRWSVRDEAAGRQVMEAAVEQAAAQG